MRERTPGVFLAAALVLSFGNAAAGPYTFTNIADTSVYRREARLSEPVRAVIRFVVEVMREHIEQLSGTPSQR